MTSHITERPTNPYKQGSLLQNLKSVVLLGWNPLHGFLVPSGESVLQAFTQVGRSSFLRGNQGKGLRSTGSL